MGAGRHHKRAILNAMKLALTAEYNYHRARFVAGDYTQADIDAYEDEHDKIMKEVNRLLNGL